jgi:hypothetical protein
MRYVAVRKVSSQNLRGMEALAKRERETNLNNMSMFSLNGSILLVNMRTRNLVHDANFGEERI